jgi:nicotinate-nucleotide adenylyltransferase
MRRALLGGTFDPPHIGHLSVAQSAWEQLSVDVVTFLPAGDPWQKSDDRAITPAAIRCEMISAAVEGIPHFEVDRRETEREGPTFTWDTIESFTNDQVILVIGADTAAGLRSWHRGDELAERVEVAVVGRPGAERAEVERAVPAVRWIEMPALNLSSTELRSWLRRGFSGRFLIPDGALGVIAENALYSEDDQY